MVSTLPPLLPEPFSQPPGATTLAIHMATTLDGRIARESSGSWHGLSSPEDRERMDLVRARHDAVVVGSETIIRDNPNMWPRQTDGSESTSQATLPQVVVLARTHLPPPMSRIFTAAPTAAAPPLLLLLADSAAAAEATTADGPLSDCCVEIDASQQWTAESIVETLRGRGFRRILLEGGPRLNGLFLAADLVEEIYLTVVPTLLGIGRAGVVSSEMELPLIDELSGASRWQLTGAGESTAGELFLHYRRRRS